MGDKVESEVVTSASGEDLNVSMAEEYTPPEIEWAFHVPPPAACI